MLVEIRIDDTDWNAASDERRREWRVLIAELIEHQPPDGAGDLRLSIASGSAETILSLERLDGTLASRAALPDDALAPHFRAYLEVCKQMTMLDEGSHSARLEALDMGKKVTHDRAARSIHERCPAIVSDHPTARRLFSLLTSLKFDTTRLHGLAGPQRPHTTTCRFSNGSPGRGHPPRTVSCVGRRGGWFEVLHEVHRTVGADRRGWGLQRWRRPARDEGAVRSFPLTLELAARTWRLPGNSPGSVMGT